MISLSATQVGQLTCSEAEEREVLGLISGTVVYDNILDTDTLLDTDYPLFYFMNDLGVVFVSTDNMVSFFSDGRVEAREFIEGSRVSIDNLGRFLIVQLREQ